MREAFARLDCLPCNLKPRQFRVMVVRRMRQNPNFVELLAIDPGILGMYVEDLTDEFAQGLNRIHVLPDHVRRIVVQSKRAAGISSNIFLQMRGLTARFLPPGHSSSVNNMGQFSMAIRTP